MHVVKLRLARQQGDANFAGSPKLFKHRIAYITIEDGFGSSD